ncbi:tRNA (guanosine(18)-2'-O)-methyltransferase TrmH [Shewanella sp. Choline-02u-19]|uniref:tRNA (guanosine(18)-2'-O)-methyltransferase TrmH n=1 Tax=unclassified Shewanella TaxID=196818 RepID=UPI000C32094D|nr:MULTISPECIES: tRNA (guanosine(18)-2'-O)-methyltransferase TrmH [unclassified Shewanella]PKG55507.1 tRNA (guanosine(18)-2'-O)-methyltransferase TrmH [Shewanella sp. GutDb-MelDb]PKG75405.1 tRNA (guanosine(18)-2'-O)-methyltransferase TrmH [Shewanella sp. GutCb]PKH60042.1 tRNA (guanosine(18)-2'-O)-methyltransferase TrmH [Shewanella sp. Bg11-22]PKI29200.1 tRNA (guanosine(18)-2'-O)-methyltransferase TrmH [Shewanella sp. Choline-02u-19]
MSPERFARINQMLDNRQPDLTLCLDTVHKSNNIAAVIRSADAVGIHEVHAVWAELEMRVSGNTASGSQQWVKTQVHHTMGHAVEEFRRQDMQILATTFSPTAVDFREIDYTRPTAIILGNERDGVSAAGIAAADQHIIIPMIGMVQSLNVSVAGALIVYEAQRQREAAGMYGTRKLDDAYCQIKLFEQGHPIYAKACRRKKLAYPGIDDTGQIVADEQWWQKMREPSA